jgi:hypothetical protein
MARLINEVVATFNGSNVELRFSDTDDLKRWADSELVFWQEIDSKKIKNRNIKSYWDQQTQFFSGLKQMAAQFDTQIEAGRANEARNSNTSISQNFSRLEQGQYITSIHEFYPAIVSMAKSDPELGALLLISCRNDSANLLGHAGQSQAELGLFLKFAALSSRSNGTKDWLLPQRKDLTAIRDESQAELAAIRGKFEEQNQAVETQRQDAQKAQENQNNQWIKFNEEKRSEWESLKKVYDEQLALLAPTQYWGSRAEVHLKVAVGFAIAFGLVLGISLWIFVSLAMPHLFTVAASKDTSTILALIPVVIPAFAGIWVLKILSRLLSENMQMMRDARERQTMVKTFLALMRDDKSGKSLINDNDRILILHSLFRPSSVTAVDDAPPVHWFDILTNKFNPKDSGK